MAASITSSAGAMAAFAGNAAGRATVIMARPVAAARSGRPRQALERLSTTASTSSAAAAPVDGPSEAGLASFQASSASSASRSIKSAPAPSPASSSSSLTRTPIVKAVVGARARVRSTTPSMMPKMSRISETSTLVSSSSSSPSNNIKIRRHPQRQVQRRWAHAQVAQARNQEEDEHENHGGHQHQEVSAPTTAPESTTSTLSTSTSAAARLSPASSSSSPPTPLSRYSELVARGLLRDDPHQRTIIKRLQAMHEQLVDYHPKEVPRRGHRGAKSSGGGLFGGLSKWFGGSGGDTSDGGSGGGLSKLEDVPKGMYLYGDVGTGKTMLMDLFYDTLPPHLHAHRRRVHFHAFMLDVFRRVHAIKHGNDTSSPLAGRSDERAVGVERLTGGGLFSRATSSSGMNEEDAIYEAAREMASEGRILCFDEFQVTDIVTAMILRQLLERMMSYGVVCVMTSNRHPDDLYKNGIQRTSFEPCIELIKKRFDVVDLDSGTDYRRIPRALSQTYFSPLNTATRREMQKLFEGLTAAANQAARRQGHAPHDPVVQGRQLTIWGRKITIPESTSSVARFSFEELCGRPLSSADYIEITRTFDTIFVEEVARMGLSEKDMARRFITFIDACYESKTRLFISSEVPIFEIFSDSSPAASSDDGSVSDHMRSIMDDLGLDGMDVKSSSLFTGQEELFAFARCVSRLVQMGTKEWIEAVERR